MSAKNSLRAFIAASIFCGQIAFGNPPALLETSELKDFETLAEPRKKLIEAAILAAKEVTGMAYLYAGNGRTYRGKPQNGFGVYDFRLPGAGGTSVMVGYGTPPKLE